MMNQWKKLGFRRRGRRFTPGTKEGALGSLKVLGFQPKMNSHRNPQCTLATRQNKKSLIMFEIYQIYDVEGRWELFAD